MGIVGQQPDRADPQVLEDQGGHMIIAFIGLMPQQEIGIYRVVACVLEVIGAQFVQKADAATFLAQVDKDSTFGGGNAMESLVQLLTAVAAERAEDIACTTFRMDTHQHIGGIGYLTMDQGQMFLPIVFPGIEVDVE